MTFSEERRKAFDFCADATKQLITLSSAIVAFMVTFGKDFVGNVPSDARIYAYLAWGGHFISVVAGIFVLLALTAQLEPRKAPTAEYVPSIRGAPATYSIIQIFAFAGAMLFTIIFGYNAAVASGAKQATLTVEQRLQGVQQELVKLNLGLHEASDTHVRTNQAIRTQYAQVITRIDESQTVIQRSCRSRSTSKPACCVAKATQAALCAGVEK